MRTEQDIYAMLLQFAQAHSGIRVVGQEGSRVNANIPADRYQDYDITFFVTEPDAFTTSRDWLTRFGEILLLQTPEDMELFPAQEKGYSFLMYFADGIKIDLTIRSVEEVFDYLTEDRLTKILLDKDGRAPEVQPTDEDYRIGMPSARSFDDCCNEFWFVVPYVAKGLYRNELLFAVDHIAILRNELRRMIGWQVGTDYGFDLRLGKNHKFLQQHVSEQIWQRLLETYDTGSYANTWLSLFRCQSLFAEIAKDVAAFFDYPYPPYEKAITRYLGVLLELHRTEAPENGYEESK